MKVHCGKVRIQYGGGFLLAELWQFLIGWAVDGQRENLPPAGVV